MDEHIIRKIEGYVRDLYFQEHKEQLDHTLQAIQSFGLDRVEVDYAYYNDDITVWRRCGVCDGTIFIGTFYQSESWLRIHKGFSNLRSYLFCKRCGASHQHKSIKRKIA